MLITKTEARRILGISRNALDNMIDRGIIPTVKSGRTVWVRKEVIDKLGMEGK